jgi:hypothetical protein
MTRDEWLSADERQIDTVAGSLSPRRRRLLAAAACRTLQEWIDAPAVEAALQTIETFADTGKTRAALKRVRKSIELLRAERSTQRDRAELAFALFVVQVAASENAYGGTVLEALRCLPPLLWSEGDADPTARLRLYPAIADITGAPATSFSPAWRTSSVIELAGSIYASRDFSAMPILADALQDSGCDNTDILHHCRQGGTHVRGCWLLDWILELS